MITYQQILDQIDQIDPIAYAKTRNFIDGAVTRLSPFISRGVISTKLVMERVLARGFSPKAAEKLIQELAWRDYFQQVWVDGAFSNKKYVGNQENINKYCHTSQQNTFLDV